MKKMRILVVDDESMILRVMERVIQATIQADVTTALSGMLALDAMKSTPFDVVISDLSMPGMDGKQLLEVVRELYPDTVRMVFTARAGDEFGLCTVDLAHQFFLKPGAMSTISDRVQRVLEFQRLLPETCSLDQMVSRISALPSIPDVYQALERELSNPNASMEKIGKIVEMDISISAKILQLVNSAFFGLREHVSSPAQAANLIGVKILRALVLSSHVFSEWKSKAIPGFSIQSLWDHSLGVASRAQKIGAKEKLESVAKEDIYVSGLFHDIGKLVIAANLPDSCTQISEVCRKDGLSLVDGETRILGVSHAEVGAYLLAVWGFPDSIVNCCAYHHSPERYVPRPGDKKVPTVEPLAIIHAADALDHESRGETSVLYPKLNMEYLSKAGAADKLSVWRETV